MKYKKVNNVYQNASLSMAVNAIWKIQHEELSERLMQWRS